MSDNQRTPVASVGIIHRERSDEATALARALEERIRATGRQVWSAERDEDSAISDRLPGTSVALVLGGDGTILSVARLVAPLNIPILGINFGRVGFLTELEPAEVEEKLPLYLAGDYWVDERSMLQAEVGDNGRHHRFIALNDIVVVRGAEPRVIRIKVWIDGHQYNTTVADGIIVSTATGSTAYNLAAGGPILHPQVRSCLITPIAPHLAADRSLILEPHAAITLELEGDSTAVLSADGQVNRDLGAGAQVVIRGNAHVTKFLRRRPPTYFYRILSAKLRDNL
ncbi:MAG TPA: NAD(+)/NADH kinase [Ktedonobacterales bacterium]|nr:NAD(+)/NADH kinase [Ktedonobacterales bacterium]